MNKIQGLLNWCKSQLNGYPNIAISNFTTSWKDGLAFNGLIHRFKPDLINYHELDSSNVYYNNYIAFKTAEIHLGIPSLLDPKDMSNMECPERLSIITYVSQFYNCLKNMAPEGGFSINKFENTNNDNSDFETISSRASVSRLKHLKCTICHQKVYLLERYVADDKLYHRKCYRTIQIKNIDSESEVMGDYLNIYGELKPTMNKEIFVHPFQGFNSKDNLMDLKTSSPVNITEETDSDIDESEILSESLSSYGFSENISDEVLHLYSGDENDTFDYGINCFTNEAIVTDSDVDCNYEPTQNIVKEQNVQSKDIFVTNDKIMEFDELKNVRLVETLNKNNEEIEKLFNNNENIDFVDNHGKEKYFEIKDFKNNELFILNKNNENEDYIEKFEETIENYTNIEKIIEKDVDKDIKYFEPQEAHEIITTENDNEIKYENYFESKIIKSEEVIKSIEAIKKHEDENNALKIQEKCFKKIIDKNQSIDKTNIGQYEEKEIYSPNCQENILNIVDVPPVNPIKQRLYVKKRDKKLPYSTFFEVSDDVFVNDQSQEPGQNEFSEILTKELKSLNKTQNISNLQNQKQLDNSKSSPKLVKKLIEIIPDEEFESDVSSLADEIYETIKPQITRNSIWRKPIISSIISERHKSAYVPLEGKFRDYAEFKDRLEELNSKQSDVETRARKIQQRLWEENSDSPFYELLLAKWLDLVEEKDKIFYEENALYSWIKDLKLQEMKMKIEAQIRLLSSSGFDDPTSSEKEKELISKLIETVNQRSELVDAMHEENVRRLETLKLRHECIENHSKIDPNLKHEALKHDNPGKSIKKFWKRKTSHL